MSARSSAEQIGGKIAMGDWAKPTAMPKYKASGEIPSECRT